MADIRRLPVPVTAIWDWQMHGACRGMNSDMFFHPERERGPARTARETQAKNVCRGCPVLQQCRDHALAVHEPYGVWGGLTVGERHEQIRTDTGAQQAGGMRSGVQPTGIGAEPPVVIGVDFTPGHHRRSRAPTPDPWPAA